MTKNGRFGTKSFENRDLHTRIGHVVITTNNVGDAEIYVIDYRRQRIEVGAILAHQYRIGHRGKIHRLRAADQIVPMHLSTLGVKRIGIEIWQQETPMRLAPL